jgi:hypothetical protein
VKPDLAKKYATILYKELSNENLPHAQIQLFIKSACTNLAGNFKNLYSAAKLTVIQNALTSSLLPVAILRKGQNREFLN